jgi:hypothetical protein
MKILLEKIDGIVGDARKLQDAIASLDEDFRRTSCHPDNEFAKKKWQDLVEYLIDTAEEANDLVRKNEVQKACE